MSNPAVITLDSRISRSGTFKRFQLEDNIGESIHLHIDEMRLDFTIADYLDFAQLIRHSLTELDFLAGYSVNDFDEHFLKEAAPFLPFLQAIRIEEIVLSELRCLVYKKLKPDLSLLTVKTIQDTPAYQYLQGNRDGFINYGQYNYFAVDNEQRLLNNLESIKTHSYPLNNHYLILFNQQNLIRDGQHRAAILAHLYGLDYPVKVMRFDFGKGVGDLHVTKQNIQVAGKWLLRKLYKRMRSLLRHYRS